MANHTGIELLPHVCRIVEVDTKRRVFGGGAPPATRVRAFHEIPYSASDPAHLTAELRRIVTGLDHRAAVAVWGLRSSHQALLLPPADAEALGAIARREARAAAGNVAVAPVADAVVIGPLREDGRREVGYAAVGSEELRSRLQPLVDAGFTVDAALTPALAHASMIGQRRALLPDAVVAVLSVNQRATALTVLRGTTVLFARELPWGGETDALDGGGDTPADSTFAGRVASELRRSLVYLRQTHKVEVTRIFLCGDLPDIRALTGPLMDALSVDVETLDVADGVDLADLPEPSEPFRSRLGAWRTALAIAADAAPAGALRVPVPASALPWGRLGRRLAIAAAAGLLIVAAGWGLVTYLSGGAAAEAHRLRRAVGALEPELLRQDEARRAAALASARAAALQAFASQGPRFARVLEAFSHAAPAGVALTALKADPGTGSWRVTVEGQVEGVNAAAAQATFNEFLKSLGDSPIVGHPVTPPSLRVRTSDAVRAPEPPSIDLVPAPAGNAVQEVEAQRPAPAGPAYIEVARDGRLYRIPLRRQPGTVDLERQNEQARQRERLAAARQQLAARLDQAVGVEDPSVRHPASVIDFTLQYEVWK